MRSGRCQKYLSFSEGICEYEELYAGGRKYVSPVFTEEMNAELAERDLAGVRNVYRGADGCGISAEDIKSPDRRKQIFEALGGVFRLVREIGGFIEQTARETGQVIPYFRLSLLIFFILNCLPVIFFIIM